MTVGQNNTPKSSDPPCAWRYARMLTSEHVPSYRGSAAFTSHVAAVSFISRADGGVWWEFEGLDWHHEHMASTQMFRNALELVRSCLTSPTSIRSEM